KALDVSGSGSSSGLSSAIVWAANHGAEVISMSWGAQETTDPVIDGALQYAYAQGIVLVAAAGNSALDASGFYPANSPYVITVAASDSSDQIAYFSNFGNKIDVAAPGVGILSLNVANSWIDRNAVPPYHIVGNFYLELAGTSQATPHVSGLAAVILSQH